VEANFIHAVSELGTPWTFGDPASLVPPLLVPELLFEPLIQRHDLPAGIGADRSPPVYGSTRWLTMSISELRVRCTGQALAMAGSRVALLGGERAFELDVALDAGDHACFRFAVVAILGVDARVAKADADGAEQQAAGPDRLFQGAFPETSTSPGASAELLETCGLSIPQDASTGGARRHQSVVTGSYQIAPPPDAISRRSKSSIRRGRSLPGPGAE
jgi:hypothetical protein